jgi:succinate dehydrogenase/fumarate reductase cytochrome b subunit
MMDANTKRSPLVAIVNVLQSFLGLVLAGLTVYLLALTRSRETLAEPDASETVHGLLIGAIVLGVPALITLVAAWGLWKRRFWGWALSLATDVGMLAVLVYSMVGENDRDGDEIALAAGFVVPAVLLLLPAVRKFFWNAGTTAKLSS